MAKKRTIWRTNGQQLIINEGQMSQTTLKIKEEMEFINIFTFH